MFFMFLYWFFYLIKQKYERALYYYEACVTIPTLAVSHIMLEAYKKFLLVTLIVHGDKTKDMTSLPKYTSPVINKYVKPLCAPYQELVVAYYSNQTADLEVKFKIHKRRKRMLSRITLHNHFLWSELTKIVLIFQNVISKYSDVFETDGNSGLVAQAAASQTKSNIKRLTKTFVTLSLTDVSYRNVKSMKIYSP